MKLLYDFFPIILFYAAYKFYGIYAATAVAMAASVVQVSGNWLVKRKIEKMHLISMGLIIVMGGLTLWLKDKTFFMWKPTMINWLFASAFVLGTVFTGKPLVQRLLNGSIELPDPVWARLNWLWVGFFVVSGFANLAFVQHYRSAEDQLRAAYPAVTTEQLEHFDCEQSFPAQAVQACQLAADRESLWADFKLFGLLGLTIIFILAQALYLAKHMPEDALADKSDTPEENS
ncbi:MAG: inner membrane-spanning protein YciB [Granulosicoccaceae bacterium]